ncbi:Nif11-like leader peptide family natural product precursor [Synechococcus sp. UW179A]|uniref:Nif11-like leader peptide family natural product precursor n=1 Tax=Synechococcus sp. UW179A TaxID=2575510 RepID=UPI000E0F5C32|nr:Nif11-like leader peptide family natural product precursor [Synechococcus sp. UW179A]
MHKAADICKWNHAEGEGAGHCYKKIQTVLLMSEDQLKAFLEKVKADPELQQKIKESKCEGCIVELAEQTGFSITTDDLIDVQLGLDSQQVTELSNEEINKMDYETK